MVVPDRVIHRIIILPFPYSGFITPEDLGTLLKSLGQDPTEEQMEELNKVIIAILLKKKIFPSLGKPSPMQLSYITTYFRVIS